MYIYMSIYTVEVNEIKQQNDIYSFLVSLEKEDIDESLHIDQG